MTPPSSDADGAAFASSDLYELVYEELRQLAHAKMSREYVYSTLQGTALVHEAWLRLGGESQPRWQNRNHFFGAAAEAMRRILVDRARKRHRLKHGGELQRISNQTFQHIPQEIQVDNQLLAINEALDKLESIDPPKAELVKLRYFFGMTFDEIAEAMNISDTTAKRWWAFARSWLHREISLE